MNTSIKIILLFFWSLASVATPAHADSTENNDPVKELACGLSQDACDILGKLHILYGKCQRIRAICWSTDSDKTEDEATNDLIEIYQEIEKIYALEIEKQEGRT